MYKSEMGYHLPSLGSKAAHFVSDLTTTILNPLSDQEHSNLSGEEEEGTEALEDEDLEKHSGIPDGPDTSSFRAFLFSLLSPSSSDSHVMETIPEPNGEMEYPTLNPLGKGMKGRKGLLARGKQSMGRILTKAARLGGFRHSSEQKVDDEIPNKPEFVGYGLELEESNEANLYGDLPVMSEPSVLLSESLRNALCVSLPFLAQGRHWVLLYSTWRHGISLSTLYRRSMLCPGYSLLIVGDKKGAVFGGLVEAPLQPTNQKKYQGTNNCFVFTDRRSRPAIYRPTGANHYFTLCFNDFLALGGGGHFALYLDGDLLSGSSSTSDTFNNPCLAHSQDFEVKEVELWGFVYASKFDEMVTLCRTESPGIWRW